MQTARLKSIAWVSAGALGVGLFLYVVRFVSRLDEMQQRVSEDDMRKVLDAVPTLIGKADDLVPYSTVELGLIDLNWTGAIKKLEKPVEQTSGVVQTPDIPVAQLLNVIWMSVDPAQPAESRCVLRYKPEAQVRTPPPAQSGAPGWMKRSGDALDGPISDIKVFAIRPEGVEFSFSDEDREHELVAPADYDLKGILKITDPSQMTLRQPEIQIPRRGGASGPVDNTQKLNDTTWQVGTKDAAHINENFAEIFASEVREARHRDPRTGRYDGIQLLEVKPDSVVSSYGVSTGDVIKSINGQVVTSVQEAISFVKNNQDVYTKWDVVVESKGQLKTLTYYSPKN